MSKREISERTKRALERRASGAAGIIRDRRLRRQRSRQAQRRAAVKDQD